MDPLHFAIMAVPLAIYLLVVGLIGVSRNPFVTTGSRDVAALAIGMGGLAIAGPMELFFPESAAGRFGSYVWLLLIAFYGLCMSLAVLVMQHRIVVYNLSPDRLRPILAGTAMKLDKRARWTGDSLYLPSLEVHLNLQGSLWLSNSQLIAVGPKQSFESWRLIEKELRKELSSIRSESVVVGVFLIVSACIVALASTWWVIAQRDAVQEALVEMLRL